MHPSMSTAEPSRAVHICGRWDGASDAGAFAQARRSYQDRSESGIAAHIAATSMSVALGFAMCASLEKAENAAVDISARTASKTMSRKAPWGARVDTRDFTLCSEPRAERVSGTPP